MDQNARDQKLRHLIQDACNNSATGYGPLAIEVEALVRPMVIEKIYDDHSRKDVIQEVQIVVFQKRQWLKDTREPTEVVCGIGRNKILHHRRYQVTGIRKIMSRNSETLTSLSGGVDPAKAVMYSEESELAEDFVEGLPPGLRGIARLKIMEELTIAEICVETGLSRDIVRRRIERIKDAYQRWPKRIGVDDARP